MNNYCTNCGKKLPKNVIKCDKCNTYVIDLKAANKKKIFRITSIVIIGIVLVIILSIVGGNLYYKNLHKSLYKKYLKNDYQTAKYVKYDSCRLCNGGCDGGCISSPKIVGCYKYYYKSDSDVTKPDIIVFSNKGDISVDAYSTVINKYGFDDTDEYEDDEDDYSRYETKRREYLYIKVDRIDEDNINEIYNMVTELINIYEKDTNDSLEITIYSKNYEEHFEITNRNTQDKHSFAWKFRNGIIKINPTIDDLIKYTINPNLNSSKSGGNNQNG